MSGAARSKLLKSKRARKVGLKKSTCDAASASQITPPAPPEPKPKPKPPPPRGLQPVPPPGPSPGPSPKKEADALRGDNIDASEDESVEMAALKAQLAVQKEALAAKDDTIAKQGAALAAERERSLQLQRASVALHTSPLLAPSFTNLDTGETAVDREAQANIILGVASRAVAPSEAALARCDWLCTALDANREKCAAELDAAHAAITAAVERALQRHFVLEIDQIVDHARRVRGAIDEERRSLGVLAAEIGAASTLAKSALESDGIDALVAAQVS